MAALAFALQCAAIAALLGAGACVLVAALVVLLRPVVRRLDPSLRGDFAFAAAVLPAVVVVAGTAATALPSIAGVLGLGHDHCLQHDHHLHVCVVHGSALPPELAVLGAAALATWLLRAGLLVRASLQFTREVRALERLGTCSHDRFPVVQIPGAPRLCHAIGVLRRRILLSASVAAKLGPVGTRSVIAHETAHLRRRDPLANLVISCAGLFLLPPWQRLFQRAYRAAAEQACDDDAARLVGDGSVVAETLLAVTKLQQAAWQPGEVTSAFGFGQQPLEARVRRLLAGVASEPRRPHALPALAVTTVIAFALAVQHAAFFHHAVETALHQLF
jgi:Zn-dependent protease with chaperone function